MKNVKGEMHYLLIFNELQFDFSIKAAHHYELGFRFRKHFLTRLQAFLDGYPPPRFAATA